MHRKWALIAVPATLVAVALPCLTASAAKPGCSEKMTGGEWAASGLDPMGQQRQDAEKSISGSNFTGLTPGRAT